MQDSYIHTDPFSDVLRLMVTDKGNSVYDLSNASPVMLVFLRHFGCTFCREALADLSDRQQSFRDEGVKLVMVHMSDEETAESYFKKYNIGQYEAISDPDCRLYQQFGLAKGTMNQLFGLRVWMRGMEAGVGKGHGIGPMLGDGFQMPGVFLIHSGGVKDKFIHQYASDRPNYTELIACCATDSPSWRNDK